MKYFYLDFQFKPFFSRFRKHLFILFFSLCFIFYFIDAFSLSLNFCAADDITPIANNSGDSNNQNKELVSFITDNLPPSLSVIIGLVLVFLGLKLILHGEEEAKKNAAAHALYNKEPKSKLTGDSSSPLTHESQQTESTGQIND